MAHYYPGLLLSFSEGERDHDLKLAYKELLGEVSTRGIFFETISESARMEFRIALWTVLVAAAICASEANGELSSQKQQIRCRFHCNPGNLDKENNACGCRSDEAEWKIICTFSSRKDSLKINTRYGFRRTEYLIVHYSTGSEGFTGGRSF